MLMEFTDVTMFPTLLKQLDRMAEWLVQDSGIGLARWQSLAGMGKSSPGGLYALNQCPIYNAVSPIARIHRYLGVEMRVAVLMTH